MKKYWFLFLIAMLVAASSEQLDKATKKWIPDDLKRAKLYQGILFSMAILYGIILFFLTKDTFYLPVSLLLSGFPVICILAGTLYAYFKHRNS